MFISGRIRGYICNDNNNMLMSLDGLDQLETLTGYINISYNSILNNLDALAKVNSVGSRPINSHHKLSTA